MRKDEGMSVAKKFLALAVVAVVLALGVVGCSSPTQEIKGNCETVVKECQNVANGDNVTVIVSGRLLSDYDAGDGSVCMTDSGKAGGAHVFAQMKDGQDASKVVGRATIKGTLSTKVIMSDTIYLKDAEVVE